LRSIDPRLPRAVWTMEAGGLVNAFGNGITFPFLVIYLHNVRGFSLGIAGLVLAANGVASLVASPAAGWLSDKIGGRLTLGGALVLMAVGFGAFPRAVARLCGHGGGGTRERELLAEPIHPPRGPRAA
jgi:MFS family permease